MQVGSLVLSFIVVATFGSIEVIQPSSSDASDETNHPVLHQSHSQEEALVWKSSTDCQRVVKDGGRMVIPDPDRLRIGTWNIRWFPHGKPPDRPEPAAAPTDLAWLACTLVWMQTDILVVQESLATAEARAAWDRILTALERHTGQTWQWSVQACGKPDGHHVGTLWNASRVTLSAFQSLWSLNGKATSAHNPCEGGLRPGPLRARAIHAPTGCGLSSDRPAPQVGTYVFAVEARQKALNRIDAAVAPFLETDEDVIILGDLNTMGAGDRHSQRSELKYLRRKVAKENAGFDVLFRSPGVRIISAAGVLGWITCWLPKHG